MSEPPAECEQRWGWQSATEPIQRFWSASRRLRLIRSFRPVDVPWLHVAPRNIALQSLVIALVTPAPHASGCELERLAVYDFGPLLRFGQRLFRFLLTRYVVCFDRIASCDHEKAGQHYVRRALKPAAQRAIACSSMLEPLSFTCLPRALHC
jgi:hypothetical protein